MKRIFGCFILLICIFMAGCGHDSKTGEAAKTLTPTEAALPTTIPTILPTKIPEPTAQAVNTEAVSVAGNGFEDDVSAIYMKDNNTGWAMLCDGSLIITHDSWGSYVQVYQFNDYDKNAFHPSISYVDSTLIVFGYFSGDYESVDVYKSEDEGKSWNISRISDSDIERFGGGDLFSSFINDQVGYLLCCGGPALGLMPKYLFKTEDGGDTYTKVADISYISGYPTGMAFNQREEGCITCTYHGNDQAYLYCTDDKGKTWYTPTVTHPKDISYAYINSYMPQFIGEDGFAIFEYVNHSENFPHYIMYHSLDGGGSWVPDGEIEIKSSAVMNGSFGNKDTAYIIDDTGKLLKLKYENKVWNEVQLNDKIVQLSMISMSKGFALTDKKRVLKTIDGGKNWSELYTITNSDNYLQVNPVIYSINENTVYIAAFYDGHTNVVSTTDGGITWTSTAIQSELSWVKDDISGYNLDFVDAKNGYLLIDCTPGAGQMFKALYKTMDGGASWPMITGDGGAQDNVPDISPSGLGGYPSSISFADINNGWAMCTSYGPYGIYMYRTDNGGKTWNMADIPEIPQEFSKCSEADLFISASKPSFYGEENKNGRMIMSFTTFETDRNIVDYIYSLSNNSWVPEGRCDTLISSCKFTDDTNGIGLDQDGNICKTEDGGLTWVKVKE